MTRLRFGGGPGMPAGIAARILYDLLPGAGIRRPAVGHPLADAPGIT